MPASLCRVGERCIIDEALERFEIAFAVQLFMCPRLLASLAQQPLFDTDIARVRSCKPILFGPYRSRKLICRPAPSIGRQRRKLSGDGHHRLSFNCNRIRQL